MSNEFWSARPVLGHIHRYAQARAAGPWGALGSVLVRATCAVPPHIMLPPIVGGPMSLNLFAALVGHSGLGKNAADAVGREAVRFTYARLLSDPIELPIGTGEGIAKTFRQADDGPDDDDAPDTAILTAPEIDTLAALIGRQGSTIEPELRKVYSGEQLGFANAQKHTRTRVAAHSYRAGLIVGAQPARCGGLFRGADGGTPQRFTWLPVDDPDAPDELPQIPEPMRIDIPAILGPHLVVPDGVRAEILAHRRAMLRRESVDPLDGHRLLSQLKVAAALMILDSPNREVCEITDEDWSLAGVVMAVSDQTREAIQREVDHKARAVNRARALDAAEREEIGDDRRLQRTREAITRWLAKVPGDGWMARRDLMPKVKANLRGYFDEAIGQLTDEDQIEDMSGDRGKLYRRVQRYSVGTAQFTSENDAVLNAVPLYPPPRNGQMSPAETTEPPGAPTKTTPGYTDRVKQVLANARSKEKTA